MKRREFIALVGGTAVAWPLAARAQQGAQLVRRIGILSGFAEDPLVESMLLRPLSQSNRDNGRNVQIDLRWGAGDIDRIRIMAKDVVASQPEVVITVGTPATVAVQRETRTIPIVFLIVADPVGAGNCWQPSAPGRQHHRVRQSRRHVRWQVAVFAERNCPRHEAGGSDVQP